LFSQKWANIYLLPLTNKLNALILAIIKLL